LLHEVNDVTGHKEALNEYRQNRARCATLSGLWGSIFVGFLTSYSAEHVEDT